MQSAEKKAIFKKRLYQWVLRIIKFIDTLPKDSVCWVIGRQVLRSGTSILANFIEATSASSRKDFINYFTYSLTPHYPVLLLLNTPRYPKHS